MKSLEIGIKKSQPWIVPCSLQSWKESLEEEVIELDVLGWTFLHYQSYPWEVDDVVSSKVRQQHPYTDLARKGDEPEGRMKA